ncbi:hypothetical protein C8F01DRAFT_779736 [Mycena amicta]|nr:hypothetical protein C8F01DRAFT_779736 [Mycena amicta]
MAIPLESDIADEFQHNPPRPTSRLAFNSEAHIVHSDIQPRRTSAFKWPKSLFHRIKIPVLSSANCTEEDVDITTVATTPISAQPDEDEELDPSSFAILPSLASAVASTSSLNLPEMDVDKTSDDSDDPDSDCSSDVDFDSLAEQSDAAEIDLFQLETTSLPVRPPSPPPTVPPHSYPVNIPTSAPLPTVPSKYSCAPSPLSPSHTGGQTHNRPLRHAYGYHGLSRHALLHVKYLWAIREDQWEAHVTRLRDAQAYSGMLQPPRFLSPQRGPSPEPPRVPPMSIHPRRGDLSVLRDPQGPHMDRCFVGMQLWTMAKTLWMYDVHLLAAWRSNQEPLCPAMDMSSDEDDGGSENESMAASISSASDDSDMTLVESEGSEDDDMLVDIPLCGKEKGPVHPTFKKPRVTHSPPNPGPRWETLWYKRWEVLIELVRLDTEREREREFTQQVEHSGRPRFFIGDDETDDVWNRDYGEEDSMMLFSEVAA